MNNKNIKVLAIIPARYASSRFPGKPLATIGGRSMIQRVCEQVQKASVVDHLIVATDDERIFEHVTALNFAVEMTDANHPSGTDRCAEVAQRHPEFEYILNVQGDEPFLEPDQLAILLQPLLDKTADVSTLAKPIDTAETLHHPNTVKVVRNKMAKAMYFSRSPIPFLRDCAPEYWHDKHAYLHHLGLYAFRSSTLMALTKLAIGELEQIEKLEQLRWLEQGYSIAVALTTSVTFGVDTPKDLIRAEQHLQQHKQLE